MADALDPKRTGEKVRVVDVAGQADRELSKAELNGHPPIAPGLIDSIHPVLPGTRRAGLGGKPSTKPDTHLDKLVRRMQDYLYLPSKDPVHLMIGTVVANMMKGATVWLVFVGPASSGKTVKLESLEELRPAQDEKGKYLGPGVHIVGGIKSEAALLSGVSRKDSVKGATGGLLKEVGERAIIVMKDFSSMLALNRDQLTATVDALRQIYDGRYERPLGTDGGIRLGWHGRIGFIAASTPAIDQHQKTLHELGERWMYYRYNKSDGYGETIKALGITDPAAMMGELRALVGNYFEELGVRWDEPRRTLSGRSEMRLFAMAAFVATARSGVPRNPYQHYEISDMPSTEGPPRLATQLGQLFVGLERAGLDKAKCWELVGRVAWDSIKQSKSEVLRAVEQWGVARVGDVRERVPLGKDTVEHLLEDLTVHGVLERAEKTRNSKGEIVKGWRLSGWAKEHMQLGWTGRGKEQGEEQA